MRIGIMVASWGVGSGLSAVADAAAFTSVTGTTGAFVMTSSQMATFSTLSTLGAIASGAAAGLTAGVLSNAAGYDVNIGKSAGLGALTAGAFKGIKAQNFTMKSMACLLM